tara:strand:- start:61641 stop:63722 length:2082 start_codon:yes stop_codon:yes gene_type:complete
MNNKALNQQFNIPSWVKGKTPAEEAKAVQKRFKDRKDKASVETMEEILQSIANKQEYFKMQEGLATQSQEVPDQMNGQIPQGMEQFTPQPPSQLQAPQGGQSFGKGGSMIDFTGSPEAEADAQKFNSTVEGAMGTAASVNPIASVAFAASRFAGTPDHKIGTTAGNALNAQFSPWKIDGLRKHGENERALTEMGNDFGTKGPSIAALGFAPGLQGALSKSIKQDLKSWHDNRGSMKYNDMIAGTTDSIGSASSNPAQVKGATAAYGGSLGKMGDCGGPGQPPCSDGAGAKANRDAMRQSSGTARKQMAADYVQKSYNKVSNHPLWNLPAAAPAPMGATHAMGGSLPQQSLCGGPGQVPCAEEDNKFDWGQLATTTIGAAGSMAGAGMFSKPMANGGHMGAYDPYAVNQYLGSFNQASTVPNVQPQEAKPLFNNPLPSRQKKPAVSSVGNVQQQGVKPLEYNLNTKTPNMGKENQFTPKNKSFMSKVGTAIGDNYDQVGQLTPLINMFNKFEKGDPIRRDTLNPNIKKNYTDMAANKNIIAEQASAARRAAIQNAGGSIAKAHSNLTKVGAQSGKAVSAAAQAAEKVNRGEDARADIHSTRVGMFNAQQSNQDKVDNRVDEAAVDNAKMANKAAVIEDISAVFKNRGQQEMIEKTLGYTRKGKYVYDNAGNKLTDAQYTAQIKKYLEDNKETTT